MVSSGTKVLFDHHFCRSGLLARATRPPGHRIMGTEQLLISPVKKFHPSMAPILKGARQLQPSGPGRPCLLKACLPGLRLWPGTSGPREGIS